MSEKLTLRSVPVLGLSVYIAGMRRDEGGTGPPQPSTQGSELWFGSRHH